MGPDESNLIAMAIMKNKGLKTIKKNNVTSLSNASFDADDQQLLTDIRAHFRNPDRFRTGLKPVVFNKRMAEMSNFVIEKARQANVDIDIEPSFHAYHLRQLEEHAASAGLQFVDKGVETLTEYSPQPIYGDSDILFELIEIKDGK